MEDKEKGIFRKWCWFGELFIWLFVFGNWVYKNMILRISIMVLNKNKMVEIVKLQNKTK